MVCALTGVPILAKGDADVIYRDPTWDKIVEGFVATLGDGARLRPTPASVRSPWWWVTDLGSEQLGDYWQANARPILVIKDEGVAVPGREGSTVGPRCWRPPRDGGHLLREGVWAQRGGATSRSAGCPQRSSTLDQGRPPVQATSSATVRSERSAMPSSAAFSSTHGPLMRAGMSGIPVREDPATPDSFASSSCVDSCRVVFVLDILDDDAMLVDVAMQDVRSFVEEGEQHFVESLAASGQSDDGMLPDPHRTSVNLRAGQRLDVNHPDAGVSEQCREVSRSHPGTGLTGEATRQAPPARSASTWRQASIRRASRRTQNTHARCSE